MERVKADLLPLLACPACGGELRDGGGLRCARCARGYEAPGGIPSLRGELDAVTAAVRALYSAAPFPGYPPRDSASSFRARAARGDFARLLDEAIAPDATLLEIGCGTGQTSLFLATGDRLVVAADLTRASLEVAAAAALRLGIDRVRFVETDLRAPGLRPAAFDVVYCSGVLHHTPDPRAAFAAIARLARPGGFVVVGVYNAYARLPHRLRRAAARLTGLRWIPLDPVLRDRAQEPARREAWLRDQYQHPQEHRHTLREVRSWLEEQGVEYLRSYPTTIIGEPPLGPGELFTPSTDEWGLESVLQQIGWSFTLGREGGLFVVVGRRRAGALRELDVSRAPGRSPGPSRPAHAVGEDGEAPRAPKLRDGR